MFELYEVCDLLTFPPSCRVLHSVFHEDQARSFLTLVLNNGHILFYITFPSSTFPLVRQIEWYVNQPSKQVKVLCIDPTGSWLLLATLDATLYLFPVQMILERSSGTSSPTIKKESMTVIHLNKPRGVPSFICWWHMGSTNLAVLGTQQGEISFVNLKWNYEIGSTSISSAISHLSVHSDQSGSFLLIGDSEGYYWRFSENNLDSLITVPEEISLGHIPPDKEIEKKPVPLTELSPGGKMQSCSKQNSLCLLYTYNSSLQIVQCEGMKPIHSWAVHATNCLVTDQIILAVDQEKTLSLLSTKTLSENLQPLDNLLQVWSLEDDVVSIFRKQSTAPLDSFLIVQTHCIRLCQLRSSPEEMFLFLCENTQNFTKAEMLGSLFGFNVHKMYEKCAENQLSIGKFSTAVHLYHLSKCSHLKRVANFMSYGYLSELTAYIQILFTTRSVEIPLPDKVHLANIMLHSFAEQVLRKAHSPTSTNYYKHFLQDNVYYDSKVAIKLLVDHKLYKLLFFAAKARGDLSTMLEQLLSIPCPDLTSPYYYDYITAITSPELLPHLAIKPHLVSKHLSCLAPLLPEFDLPILTALASLYDPSRPAFCFLNKTLQSSGLPRFIESPSSSTESLNYLECQDTTEEELLKFFLFVLLVIENKRDPKATPFNVSMLEPPVIMSSLTPTCPPNYQMQKLSAGKNQVGFIRDYTLFTWGGGKESGEKPQPVSIFRDIRVFSIVCGANHYLALTESGVFSWGSSRYGQLGISGIQSAHEPQLIESLGRETIVAIAAGQYHSLALTADNRVYSWGWGVHGQLGLGNAENYDEPQLVTALRDVVQVCGGQAHSIALTSQGEVFGFGCGLFGQLGNGGNVKSNLPGRVFLPEMIKSIALSFYHSLACSVTGKLYMWGSSPQVLKLQATTLRQSRQLQSPSAMIPAIKTHLVPQLVCIPSLNANSQIAQISCGCAHSAFVTTDGDLYTWGHNIEGQLGHGSRKDPATKLTPTKLQSLSNQSITSLSCGSNFTLVTDSTDKLWGWGGNESGQLGFKSNPINATIPNSALLQSKLAAKTRRILQYAHLSRQVCLEPIEVKVVSDSKHNNLAAASIDFDSCSYDGGHMSNSLYCQMLPSLLPPLKNLDTPSYGPKALQTFIQNFYRYWDTSVVLERCVSLGALQAAAFLCVVNGNFIHSVEYQLQALRQDQTQVSSLPVVLDVLNYYTKKAELNDPETIKKFLKQVSIFWLETGLSLDPFEIFVQNHIKVLGYPLCLMLLSEEVPEFFSKLSVHFILDLMSQVLTSNHGGRRHSELLAFLETDLHTKSRGSSMGEGIWSQLSHTFEKGLIRRLSFDAPVSQLAGSETDLIMLFTCGHQYPAHQLREDILPQLGLPEEVKAIYQQDGYYAFACPHCLALELL